MRCFINEQIVHTTMAMLSQTLESLYAPDFGDPHYQNLIESLGEQYDQAFLHENRGAIKKGIVQFFADSSQAVRVAIVQNSIKIEKEIEIDEATDRALFDLRYMLGRFEEGVEKTQRSDHIFMLSEKAVSDLFECFHPTDHSADWIKERLRQEFVNFYGLEKRDMVLFFKGVVFIIFFREPTVVKAGQDRRFAGWNAEELNALVEFHFPEGKEEIWNYLQDYLSHVLDDQLNFTKIDNGYYEERFIRVFRSTVEIFLHDYLAEVMDAERSEPLSSFVMRQQFDSILLFTARELLKHFYDRNIYAEKFLKAYDGTIVVTPSGKRIQRKAIVDAQGNKWGAGSILSVKIQRDQLRTRIDQQDDEKLTIQKRCKGASISVNNETATLQEKHRIFRETKKAYQLSQMALRQQGNKRKRKSNAEMIKAQKEHDLLLAKLRTAESQARHVQQRLATNKTNLQTWKKQLDTVNATLNRLEKEYARVEETICGIEKALAKSMVSR